MNTIERKFPECLSFVEELTHVDRASRVSLENVQRTLRQMETNIRNLEQDLTNAKVPQCDEDLFIDVMKVSFVNSLLITIDNIIYECPVLINKDISLTKLLYSRSPRKLGNLMRFCRICLKIWTLCTRTSPNSSPSTSRSTL